MILTADRIIHDGYAYSNIGLELDTYGRIAAIAPLSRLGTPDIVLSNRVLIPGTVNAHSHSFQRLLRGKTQISARGDDNFWTWRQAMYWVASSLTPHGAYIAARQVFLEMLMAGITTVGEFHYLHHQPDGSPYPNEHEMTEAIVQAARSVGIRCSMLYAVYLRGNFDTPPQGAQQRFCAKSLDAACDSFDSFVQKLLDMGDYRVSWGIAAHSVRAMPIDAILGLKARLTHMPFHIHAAEQRKEVEDCIKHNGTTPIDILAKREIIDACTTVVHATHLHPGEAASIARLGGLVCICPSTEADLGDGLAPARELFEQNVSMCFGSDGQTITSILSEAAKLEMNERMRFQKRNVLTHKENESVATHLLKMATAYGATSLGIETGQLRVGKWADFTALDLNDPSLAGSDDHSLLSNIIFSSDSRAVKDVFVAGQHVIQNGEHEKTGEILSDYQQLHRSLFEPPHG